MFLRDYNSFRVLVFCAAAFALLVAAAPAVAQLVPGEFSAMLVVSEDYSLLDRWYKTVPGAAPRISTSEEINPDQIFCLYLFVGGFNVGDDGKANVAFDFSIADTAGTVVYEMRDLLALNVRVENTAQVMLSQTTPYVTLEPWHEFGDYRVTARLRDSISGKTFETSDTVSFVPYQPVSAPVGDSALSEWTMSYYEHPSPDMLVEACIAFVSGPMYDRAKPAGHGFFEAALENNPQLIPYLTERMSTLQKPVRSRVSKLLGSLDFSTTRIGDSARMSVTKLLKGHKGMKFLSDNKPVSKPDQLDYLWGRFFATGSYESFRRIVTAFNLESYLKFVDPSQAKSLSRRPSEDDRMKGAACLAAGWSLISNAKQHELVRQYLVYMLSTEKLTKAERRMLDALLKE
jgi:hypothetical protein